MTTTTTTTTTTTLPAAVMISISRLADQLRIRGEFLKVYGKARGLDEYEVEHGDALRFAIAEFRRIRPNAPNAEAFAVVINLARQQVKAARSFVDGLSEWR